MSITRNERRRARRLKEEGYPMPEKPKKTTRAKRRNYKTDGGNEQ